MPWERKSRLLDHRVVHLLGGLHRSHHMTMPPSMGMHWPVMSAGVAGAGGVRQGSGKGALEAASANIARPCRPTGSAAGAACDEAI